MVEGQKPRNLRYFVAKFGEKYEGEHPVEGECYPLTRRYWPSNWYPYNAIREGDVVFLYCFKNYFGDIDKIPGIGIVYHINEGHDENTLWYHYLPVAPDIDSNTIITKLTGPALQDDLDGILHAWLSPYRFLFMIKNESARALLAGCQINWP